MERKPYWNRSYNHPLPPFSRSLRCAPARAGLPSATTKDRFATLSWWANRSCFFLWFHRGNTLFFQSVARQILYLRGCLKVLFTSTNTARAQGWGNPRGATPLVLGVQGPGGPWRIFGDFLFVRKSPGVWGGAPIQRGVQRGPPPPRPSVGWNPTDPTPSGHSPDPGTPACCKASSPADSLGKPPGGTAWPAGRPQTATQKSGGRSPCRGSRG